MPRLLQRLFVAAFFAFLAMPPLAMLAGVGDSTTFTAEKRELTPPPAFSLSWRVLSTYPQAVQHWFEDNFGFRAWFIRTHARLSWEWLHVSPSDTVLRGRDGWLFYADDGAMEDYQSATPLGDDELRHWQETLEATRDWLRARGIGYVFVLAPDKHVVYPEFLPAGVHRLGAEYRFRQLAAYMHAHSDVPVIDLTDSLMAAKSRERIYARTDTHWNDRGAFIGYQQILAPLLPGRPALVPRSREAFDDASANVEGEDLAGMLGLKDRMIEIDLSLRQREPRRARVTNQPVFNPDVARVETAVDDPALPRAVVFRDSFAGRLIPFLAEHFSRAVYLWQNDFDPAVVLEEHPDVVIHEIVGRRLTNFVPYNAVAGLRN